MKLYLYDKPVKLIRETDQIDEAGFYSVLNKAEELLSRKLEGKVLVKSASLAQIERFLKLIEIKKLKKLVSITFAVQNYSDAVDFMKDQFKIVKAAGGIVRKNDKVLMIYRLDKWDLPKGKLKKKEESAKGAKREVEEECQVKVKVIDGVCSTWHSYSRKGKRMLKQTDWYLMDCLDDSKMQPQKEEFIEEVKWMNQQEVVDALKNSYHSIHEVFSEFYKKELDPIW